MKQQLIKSITSAIIKRDDSLSIDEFAEAVATIVANEYGEHNYETFIKIIKNKLNK
jgi:6-phosphogluconate dehydrogenase (decarboxylating)